MLIPRFVYSIGTKERPLMTYTQDDGWKLHAMFYRKWREMEMDRHKKKLNFLWTSLMDVPLHPSIQTFGIVVSLYNRTNLFRLAPATNQI